MAVRHLYLVRHGQYDPSIKASDDLESGLTALGKKQALKTAKALAKTPIDKISFSTMRRTEETAQPIIACFPEVKQERSRRLWERIPCVSTEYRSLFSEWTDAELAAENQAAELAFAQYFRPTRGQDKHQLLVTHGNLIRYLVCRVLGTAPDLWLKMESFNCGITRVNIDPDGFATLVSYNDVGHLPLPMRTDNLHR